MVHISLLPVECTGGKKKWLVRNMSVRPHIHRLFDTYEKA